jgi:hypothetical protein
MRKMVQRQSGLQTQPALETTMIAKLEFNLPEEEDQHRVALHGHAWRCVSEKMDEWLRGKIKYGHDFKDADEALYGARAALHTAIRDEGVNLHE